MGLFSHNGRGAYSPGAPEITAALRAAKSTNSIGVSFFQ
jgi:hypothetical protein